MGDRETPREVTSMTDAQQLALIRYMVTKADLRRIEYNANDNPPVLNLGFYDEGGNWHMHGILPDGKLRVYDAYEGFPRLERV
jgi:hypothetical protein